MKYFTSEKEMKTPKSKKLRVYETLKQQIINRTLEHGEPINEAILSRELKTSKTPIREALLQLEKEGFIKSIPGRGNFVSGVSIQDFREIFEIREILECAAIKRAALKRDPVKLDGIRKAFENATDSTRDGWPRNLRSGDQIHSFIFESLENQRLLEIYGRLQDHIVRHRIHFSNGSRGGRPEQSYAEHLEILDALAAQDPVRCEEAMRIHLRNSLDYVKSTI